MGKRLILLSIIMIVLVGLFGCEDKVIVNFPEDTKSDTVFDTIVDTLVDSLLDTTGIPTVEIINPQDGASVGDYIHLQVKTTDDKGVTKVIYFGDNEVLGTSVTPPFDKTILIGAKENGRNLRLFVVAIDADSNYSTSSKTVTYVVDTNMYIPASPYLYNPEIIVDDSVRISWTEVDDYDMSYYIIRWDTSSVHSPTLYAATIPYEEANSIVIPKLYDFTFYRFAVEAFDQFGNSSMSNVRDIITPNRIPDSILIRSIKIVSEGVAVDWLAPDIWDFSNYKVFRSYDLLLDESDQQVGFIQEIDSTIIIDTEVDFSEEEINYFLSIEDRSGLENISGPFPVGARYNPHSLRFNGYQYATVPHFTGLDIGPQYTLEAWVKPEKAQEFARVIDKSPAGDPYFQYSITCSPTLGTDFCSGYGYERITSGESAPLNQWSHLAITYEYGLIKFYINGVNVRTVHASASLSCSSNTPLVFGRRRLYDEFYFTGYIDEVRIWNIVRTDTEILDNYYKYVSLSEPGLVEYYGFDTGEGSELIGGKGHNGYLGNSSQVDQFDPTWSEDVPLISK